MSAMAPVLFALLWPAAVWGSLSPCDAPGTRFRGEPIVVRRMETLADCRAACVKQIDCWQFSFITSQDRRLVDALPTLPPKIESSCHMFDATAEQESAGQGAISGPVVCAPSESRPPLSDRAVPFLEVDREGEAAPSGRFGRDGVKPTNAWWTTMAINKELGVMSNFMTQMPYILGPAEHGVHVMQPFMTSPGMEEFQHGLGVFLGYDGQEDVLSGPVAENWDEACVTMAYRKGSGVSAKVHSKFEWGSPWVSRDFKFVGRRIKQREDGTITIDQEGYVAEVPLTKTKLEPSTPLQDYPDLVTEYRSGIGSLQWLAGTTRGDISADVSLIQKPPKDLLVSDLLEINAVLRYVRATQDSFVRLHPVNLTNLLFICYGDSGWGNAYGGKSQGGLLVVATDDSVYSEPRPGSILEWKSYRHQRVLRSTLAAEACALDRAQDYGNYLALMFSEMTDGQFLATHNARPAYPVIPVTDSRSVWDSVHRMSTTFAEKRVEVDIAGLRESCRGLRWVPTEQQKADCLTKRSKTLRDEFRKFLANPSVTLTEARSAEDMLTGQANAKWR